MKDKKKMEEKRMTDWKKIFNKENWTKNVLGKKKKS